MSGLIDLIREMQSPFDMVAIVSLLFAVAGVLSVVAKQIRKFACHRQEIEFKRELLDRGMAIEEIERIATGREQSMND